MFMWRWWESMAIIMPAGGWIIDKYKFIALVHYVGSYTSKSDTVLAHGGAGFAPQGVRGEGHLGAIRRCPRIIIRSTQVSIVAATKCSVTHSTSKYGVRFGENHDDEKLTWGFNRHCTVISLSA